jgi:hypothetical protein
MPNIGNLVIKNSTINNVGGGQYNGSCEQAKSSDWLSMGLFYLRYLDVTRKCHLRWQLAALLVLIVCTYGELILSTSC